MCTPLNPFPGGSICSVLGDAPFNFIAFGNTPPYLTPAGCANLCTQTANCLSFFLSTDNCILYAGTQENNGFTADGSSLYTGYDLDCFNCAIITTTVTPSTATSSSAYPSASSVCILPPAALPPTAVCGAYGYVSANSGYQTFTEPQYSTIQGCANLCSTTTNCQSILLSSADSSCNIFFTSQATAGFTLDPATGYEAFDLDCFCGPSSTTLLSATSSSQPSTTSSSQPSATCPPAGAICNTIGVFSEDPSSFVIDQSPNPDDTTLVGCSALCATNPNCVSWDLGEGYCSLFSANQVDIGFEPDPSGDFIGSDAACLCPPSSSVAPSTTSSPAMSSAQSTTSSVQSTATCIPPAGAICNTIGVFPGDPSAFVIDQSPNPDDTTLAGCSALCATNPNCVSWDLGEGYCSLFSANQVDIGFEPDPSGDFIGSDAVCLCPPSSSVAPSTTSSPAISSAQQSTTSAQQSATSSSQPTATCIHPAGAICNAIGDFPGDPTPFIIDQSNAPQDTTLAGCSALCSTVPQCLSWDLGGGFCFLLNADQANSGFVADPQGAFEGSDAACLICVSSTTSAQLSTTSSTQPSYQPSATCIPPAGAICNGIGSFPGDPTPFIIDQSGNPDDTTLAGCSALCSTVPQCLSWDLGGGFCFLLNADQADSGFVADPQGAFEGSDAACLICISSISSAQSSAQLSTTSSAQPSAQPSVTSSAQLVPQPSSTQASSSTSSVLPSAIPSLALPSSALPSPAMSSLALRSLASSSVFALPSIFATPASPSSSSVLERRSVSLSTIQQSSVQTAIPATLSQAALLSATISVATAPALSFVGQSSVPIAFASAPKSQASLKYSNYSVSIGSFSGAIQTPSPIAPVTPGAVISSLTTALPSAIPLSGFFRVINPALPAKRQLDRPLFLKVNIDGTVSRTRGCSSASIFYLETNGQLTSNGLTAFATTGDIVNGISDLTFGLNDPANIQATFALSGDTLEWNNNAFSSGQAIFAFPPIPPFVVNAIFDGTVPDGYTETSFEFLNVAAADALCGLSSTTGTVATTLMTTSTVCTTIVYTITKCPPTVYNCPIGHKTTETIPLYTTVCPVDPGKPTGPIYNIGVLVTIFIDITIEINIQNGVLETIFVTDIILSTENGLYNAATSAQPCYPCQLSSHGYKCPKSGVTVTQSICRSCPTFYSPPIWAAPVVQTCSTCAPFTLFVDAGAAPTSPAELALGLPVAMGPANGGAGPQAEVQSPGQPPVNGAAVVTPAVDFPSQPAANVAAVVTQESGQNTPPQNAEGQFGGNPPAAASSLAGGVSAPASPQQASDAVRLLKFTMRAFIFFVLSIFWL